MHLLHIIMMMHQTNQKYRHCRNLLFKKKKKKEEGEEKAARKLHVKRKCSHRISECLVFFFFSFFFFSFPFIQIYYHIQRVCKRIYYSLFT